MGDEESSARGSSRFSPLLLGKLTERGGGAGAVGASRYTEVAYYGVFLKKMRKVLTIRQEYVIVNRTLFDFVIKITNKFDKTVTKEYILKVDESFGLNCNYFRNYNIQFRMHKDPN